MSDDPSEKPRTDETSPDGDVDEEAARLAKERRRQRRKERLTKEEASDASKRRREDREPDEERDGPADEEVDPYWWIPHAVLLTILLLGLVGYFGGFQKH